MSDEETLAEVTAQEPVVTATPEIQTEQPEVQAEEKTFTQDELNEIIGKRLAKERRAWERSQQQQVAPPPPLPAASEFESDEAYRAAIIEQHETAKRAAEAGQQFAERIEKAVERYDDFEKVAYNPELKISNVMAEAIRDSDVGPEVAYYLGLNPDEAARIAALPPMAQAKEIGKLEVKVTAEPPVKKVTNAPEPIQPGRPRGSSTPPVMDTTDPRSIKAMTTSEWIDAENLRLAKKLGYK